MVVEHGAGNLSGCAFNKVYKLVSGEQTNAKRLDLGRTRVFKRLAGQAAPIACLMVKAGDKLLLLGALGALRTLELNTQILLEPLDGLGDTVDKRLDERRVGNAAADGLDGVDKVLFVVFVDGPNKPEAPGAREEARPAHGLAGACDGNGRTRACCFYGGAKASDARSDYQYIS